MCGNILSAVQSITELMTEVTWIRVGLGTEKRKVAHMLLRTPESDKKTA